MKEKHQATSFADLAAEHPGLEKRVPTYRRDLPWVRLFADGALPRDKLKQMEDDLSRMKLSPDSKEYGAERIRLFVIALQEHQKIVRNSVTPHDIEIMVECLIRRD